MCKSLFLIWLLVRSFVFNCLQLKCLVTFRRLHEALLDVKSIIHPVTFTNHQNLSPKHLNKAKILSIANLAAESNMTDAIKYSTKDRNTISKPTKEKTYINGQSDSDRETSSQPNGQSNSRKVPPEVTADQSGNRVSNDSDQSETPSDGKIASKEDSTKKIMTSETDLQSDEEASDISNESDTLEEDTLKSREPSLHSRERTFIKEKYKKAPSVVQSEKQQLTKAQLSGSETNMLVRSESTFW